MVLEIDVTTTLIPIISDSMFGDGKVINLSDGGFVYVSFFTAIFQESKSMKAIDLHEVDSTKNLGYSQHIDEWEEKGYLPR
jgi:hypothetical protein